MNDNLDIASEREEIDRLNARMNYRKPEPVIHANGHCHECNAVVSQGMRWCDALCRDDWERENSRPNR